MDSGASRPGDSPRATWKAGLARPGWPRPPWRTRFAPAPTGRLHLGHAVNAICVWGLAHALGGTVLLRIEDHDRMRCRAEHERALFQDLEWLGLEPDTVDGVPWVRQSERDAIYAAALSRLEGVGLVYPCDCSRSAILAAAPAPDGAEPRYPGTCRVRGVPKSATPMRRVRLERRRIAFDDLAVGRRAQIPAEQCGDLSARDRDGHWTYQFAVTVDDLEQGIDLVIRGEDLLESTGRQIQLAGLLGRARPAAFFHHPLLLRSDGRKLSKSAGDTGLGELRAAGWSPARVLAEAARRAGLLSPGSTLAPGDLADLVGERHLPPHRG